jgi:hypothetical protein
VASRTLPFSEQVMVALTMQVAEDTGEVGRSRTLFCDDHDRHLMTLC